MTLDPLGEVGANFSLQLSSRTQFTKINNKKVIAENQCEKHKKSSFFFFFFINVQAHLFGGRDMSRRMRFPTMWLVRPANAQTSLRIRAV